MLRLLHLSDIHFRRGIVGGAHDLDMDLRNELTKDATSLREKLGDFSVILVSGDIAFSGMKEEYEYAATWLKELCLKLGVPEEMVWPTPGNHDVDRASVDRDEVISLVHQKLRECSSQKVDQEIYSYFAKSPTASTLLLEPLRAYSEFAMRFGCALTSNKLFWQQHLPLNDGSTLIVRGLNSTLISDARDDDNLNKLVLGDFQSVCQSADGVTYLTLCHHPPGWLRDGDAVEANLQSRVAIQLFGHKHKQLLNQIDNCIRLTAGAMHPSRDETPWQPRFNVIEVEVTISEGKRELRVNVYQRVWNEATRDFNADVGGECREYKLNLPPWSRAVDDARTDQQKGPDSVPQESAQREKWVMDKARRLAYRFLTLPYHTRIAIAQQLDLIADEDQGATPDALFVRFFERAREQNKLAEFWSKVEHSHTDPAEPPNPFAQEDLHGAH